MHVGECIYKLRKAPAWYDINSDGSCDRIRIRRHEKFNDPWMLATWLRRLGAAPVQW